MATAIDTVLLKTASRCNINCAYCYVYNAGDDGWRSQPPRMSEETIRLVLCRLRQLHAAQEHGFAVVLHGGEPLLLGMDRLVLLLRGLRALLPDACSVSIQTNGILITRELLDLCSETRTSISVSLDGPAGVHDRSRLDLRGRGTFDRVLGAIRQLKAHPDAAFLFAGTLSVIDPQTDPRAVYRFFKNLGVPSMDFLFQDGNHSCLPRGKSTFESTEYGTWLSGLFDEYLADPRPVPIRVLDDLVKVLFGGRGTKEGMGTECYGIVIVETDGTITKNDTLKSSYNGADRFEEPWSLHTHSLHEIAQTEIFKSYLDLQRPSSPVCRECPDVYACGGGMPLYRFRQGGGYDNPSVYCNDHKLLIRQVRGRLLPLGRTG